MQLIRRDRTGFALGGGATIGIIAEDTFDFQHVFAESWLYLYRFEKRFSRFLPDSELSIFNASAGLRTTISSDLYATLQTAHILHKKTNGLFDPMVLPAVQRIGYLGSAIDGYEKDKVPDYRGRHVGTFEQIQLEPAKATIPYGTALDFGGFGKGYAADEIGQLLRKAGAKGYFIEISGDVATWGIREDGSPLTIAIKRATGRGVIEPVITAPPTKFGIASSGTFKRLTQATTMKGHHTIDPTTRRSAKTDLLLATVCAPSAALAEAYATAAIIVGSKKAIHLLPEIGALDWVLQTADDVLLGGDHVLINSTEKNYAHKS